MTSEQFTYWLQGFVELNGEIPTKQQWDSVKEHLKTVFNKVTPPVSATIPPTIQIPHGTYLTDPRTTQSRLIC